MFLRAGRHQHHIRSFRVEVKLPLPIDYYLDPLRVSICKELLAYEVGDYFFPMTTYMSLKTSTKIRNDFTLNSAGQAQRQVISYVF